MKNYYFIVRGSYIGLGLSGVDLLVFSVIASCHFVGSKWTGSNKTLAKILGCSVRSIERSLNHLLDLDFIFMNGGLELTLNVCSLLDDDNLLQEYRQNVAPTYKAKNTI